MTACVPEATEPTGPGVPATLAAARSETISDLRYDIELTIPVQKDEPVRGRLTARFERQSTGGPLVFDFAPALGSTSAREAWITGATVNGAVSDFAHAEEHVSLPERGLTAGVNEVSLDFIAGDGSLNRNEDFLYTLFVPDRARYAFPVFDQPNLKARYRLQLEVPLGWEASANGPLVSRAAGATSEVLVFAETEPISTYVFAFAAGRFEVITEERNGRSMRFLHRESDSGKVERNVGRVLDLHMTALDWLEDYTGVPYPFAKLDFVAVPGFQYGGMEHSGNVFYRARSLFLDESASQNQILGRASLIAHEVAHMWFGNLVTMSWFSDVWLKEVLANFMAAKVVHPSFPEVDHDLRFLLAHYPRAYDVDRTAGANPIRQELDNLNEAGSLYGAVIYQKAPVVMKHLEGLMGEEPFRQGLQSYLSKHAYGNAAWPDLIEAMRKHTEVDLESWSRVWVGEPGRPTIRTEWQVSESTGALERLDVEQMDPRGDRLWPQALEILLGYGAEDSRILEISLADTKTTIEDAAGLLQPDYVLAGLGAGYGEFVVDPASQEFLLRRLPELVDTRTRAVAWLSLWDSMLERRLEPGQLMDLALRLLQSETNELLEAQLLGDVRPLFWRYLSSAERQEVAGTLESVLWDKLTTVDATTRRGSLFRAYLDTALTQGGTARLEGLWSGALEVAGLSLSVNDRIALAQGLALRDWPGAAEILDQQRIALENPDVVARFDFVRPAFSSRVDQRELFFAGLAEPENREREPWVLDAVRALHHPLRADESRAALRPSLELLEEVQRTGDIFFPLGWLSATFSGHSSPETAQIVDDFLAENPELPPRLRGKVLQAADPLQRAARLREMAEP